MVSLMSQHLMMKIRPTRALWTKIAPRPILVMALVDRNVQHDHQHGMHFFSATTTSPDNNNKPLFSSNHKHFPLPGAKGSVIYTETDEAPALATYSLYPVVSKVRDQINAAVYRWYYILDCHNPYPPHLPDVSNIFPPLSNLVFLLSIPTRYQSPQSTTTITMKTLP